MLTMAINHGIVIDVNEKKQRKLNVGICGDRIVELSETTLEAAQTIDASGLIVSPGFIDVHGHVDGDDYAGELSLCQGITTTIGGNCGYSPLHLDQFFREQEEKGFPIHQAMLTGHGVPLRKAVGVEDNYAAATSEQIAQMVEIARRELESGACGISFGLDYTPGCSMEEIYAMAALCESYDRVCPVHTRLLTEGDMYSLYEIILAARKSKAKFLISHFVYQYCGGLVEQGLRMVDRAREQGCRLRIDSGMYTNWATGFDSATFDYRTIVNSNWKWEQMVVATGPNKGKVMTEELYHYMQAHDRQESVILFEGNEEEVYPCLRKPYAMPSTDIGAYEKGEGHPQIAGSFPRYFRKMVTERKELTLEEAVYKATLLPADTFSFEKKGRLAPGMDADVTIFDIDRIYDKATYPNLGLPDARPEGIPYVIVGGVLAVDGGVYQHTRSGRTIRSHRR